MPIIDANDPASHCLGLNQPFQSPYAYYQSARVYAPSLLNNSNNGISFAYNGTSATVNGQAGLSPNPPNEELDYEGALNFLFTVAKHDPVAKELCRGIDLQMNPPMEAGILQYLFRLQAIGRLQEWPVLFGGCNSFILYLLEKMSREEPLKDSENERAIWDQRRSETQEWMRQRQTQ